jgi:glycosyltransferase involved in cell wall biosynthesis
VSSAIVCVSAAMADEIKAKGRNLPDLFTIRNGVGDAFISSARIRAPQKTIRVVSVGSMIKRKGYDVLIAALAQMNHGDRVHIRVAGDGPELKVLRDQATHCRVAERIEFVGALDPERVPAFLKDSDLFVLPSRSEGRPNSVVEALASGLPVIASRIPGVEELVFPERNGWLFSVNDSAELARILGSGMRESAGDQAALC